MDLLRKIERTEQSYTYITSEKRECETHIIFQDRSDVSTPLQSYIYIKKEADIEQIREIIHHEHNRMEREKRPYLRIVFSPELSDAGEIPELAEATFSHYQILYKNLLIIDDLYADRNCYTLTPKERELLLDTFSDYPKDQQLLMKRWIDMTLDIDQLERVIYKENNRVLGSCELFRGDGIMKLEDLEVVEKYREQGVASAILKSATAITKHIGYNDIYLLSDSDTEVTDFYRNRGFHIIGDYNSATFYR